MIVEGQIDIIGNENKVVRYLFDGICIKKGGLL